MTIEVWSGTGILSGVYDHDQIAREREEERIKEEADADLYASQCDAVWQLETMLEKELADELTAELEERRISPETMKQHQACVKKFRAYCAGHFSLPLPPLPASPSVVAAFIADEC